MRLLFFSCMTPMSKSKRIRTFPSANSNLGRMSIILTDKALEAIADGAYQPEFGARPIQRYLERNVERPLSHAILAGEVSAAKPVTIDYDGEKFVVR